MPKVFDQDKANVIPIRPADPPLVKVAKSERRSLVAVCFVATPIPEHDNDEYDKWRPCANCGEVATYTSQRRSPEWDYLIAEYLCYDCAEGYHDAVALHRMGRQT